MATTGPAPAPEPEPRPEVVEVEVGVEEEDGGGGGGADGPRPSWMSPSLGVKQSTQAPRVEQLEQLEPLFVVDELEQQEPPDVPTTDEQRVVVELDLIGQIAALQRKLDAAMQPEAQDDVDQEEALQAILEDPPLPTQGGPSRVLLLTYQLPVQCFRDEHGTIQWTPTSGEANLAHAMAGVPDSTEVVWFGQINEADTGDIREDEKADLGARTCLAAGLISSARVRVKCVSLCTDWPFLSCAVKQLRTADSRFSMVPVFLPKATVEKWYDIYCLKVLWPTFHYMEVNISQALSDHGCFQAYVEANAAYAAAVRTEWKSSDLLWVINYELLLVPQQLRRRIRDVRVGLFVHCPWPSNEIFRSVPNTKEILEGMLGADIVGFHNFSFSRHFLSSCMRILGVDASIDSVEYKKHTTSVKIFSLGTDPDIWENMLDQDPVHARLEQLRHSFKDKKVMLGVDALDYIKGIPLKLHAFEKLLASNPELVGSVVLVQVAYPPWWWRASQNRRSASSSSIAQPSETREYAMLRMEVNRLVGRINGAYGTATYQPVYYINKFVSMVELTALYRVADAAVVTCIREGINLICQEFVCCQPKDMPEAGQMDEGDQRQGVLIISEFSGSVRTLAAGALQVNPWHADQVATSMLQVINMSAYERKIRFDTVNNYVREHTARLWALHLCTELQQVIPPSMLLSMVLPAFKDRAADVYTALSRSRPARLFIFDYDASYLHKSKKGGPKTMTRRAEPSVGFLSLIEVLCQVSSNVVVIISCRSSDEMTQWFGRTRAVLASERGCYLRLPFALPDPEDTASDETPIVEQQEQQGNLGKQTQEVEVARQDRLANIMRQGSSSELETDSPVLKSKQEPKALPQRSLAQRSVSESIDTDQTSPGMLDWAWHPLLDMEQQGFEDAALKEKVLSLLRHYEERTPGSFIMERQSSVVYQFHETDPEYASWQSKELTSLLHDVLANAPLEVVSGSKFIEVRTMGVTQELVMENVLQSYGRVLQLQRLVDDTDDKGYTINALLDLRLAAAKAIAAAHMASSGTESISRILPGFVFSLGTDSAGIGEAHGEEIVEALRERCANHVPLSEAAAALDVATGSASQEFAEAGVDSNLAAENGDLVAPAPAVQQVRTMLPSDAAIFAVTVGSRTRKADSSMPEAVAGSSAAASAPYRTSGLMEMHAPKWEEAAQILDSVATYHHQWSSAQALDTTTPPSEQLQPLSLLGTTPLGQSHMNPPQNIVGMAMGSGVAPGTTQPIHGHGLPYAPTASHALAGVGGFVNHHQQKQEQHEQQGEADRQPQPQLQPPQPSPQQQQQEEEQQQDHQRHQQRQQAGSMSEATHGV
eukprot:COSAG02_NODE_108_length_36286_cov_19.437478_26_plen_1336_part_00